MNEVKNDYNLTKYDHDLIEDNFNFSTMKKEFIDYLDVSQKTILTYDIALNQFGSWLRCNNINNPTRKSIVNYREYLKKEHKPTTVNSYLIAVRNFFKFLEYEGLYKNVADNIKGVKIKNVHLREGLSSEEIKKVIDACKNEKEVLLVKLMVVLGLRCQEVCNIKIEDFYKDEEVYMLRVLGKNRGGYKQDALKVDERLYFDIMNYASDRNIKEYLFFSESNHNYGGKVTVKTISCTIKEIFKRANLDNIELKTAHSLRHSTTINLLDNGVPIQEVSEFMRHKNLQTTMIYNKELNQKRSICSNITANLFY